MAWLHGAIAVFQKDARLELRTRFALNALALFVAAAVLLVRFAVGNAAVTPPMSAALLWIVILFAAVVGLGRAFIVEEERGTVLLLQLALPATPIYVGKLAFNIAITLALNFAAALIYWLLVSPEVYALGLLVTTLVLGAVGLAGATTLLSAIIARTVSSGPLLAVLSFPVLIPLLFSVVQLTQLAFEPGATWSAAATDLTALVGYGGLMITASVMLFEYVWRD